VALDHVPSADELARVALERFGGGFALWRAVYEDDEVVDWEIVDANTTTTDLIGRGCPVVGRRVSEVFGRDLNAEVAAMQVRALESGEPLQQTIRVAGQEGAVWRRLTFVKVAPGIVASLSSDLDGLAEAQARARTLGEHTTDIVVISTLESGVLWVSPSVERALGFSPDDFMGRCAADIIHPDDVDTVVERFLAVASGPGSDAVLELRARCADGSFRWFECTVVNRTHDELVNGVILIFHDIDARKRSEDALRISEIRIREILETAGDAIITVDEDGRIEHFNRAAERIFRVPAAHVVGRSYHDLIGVDSQRSLDEAYARFPAGGSVEVTLRRGDGDEFVGLVSFSEMDVDGRVIRTTMVRDVTAERRVEVALEQRILRDELTGLPNRRRLVERLEEAITHARETCTTVGVIFLDLDRFKLVNDSLGHDVGDELLVRVADRLRAITRDGDAARLGGDEFVVLCAGMSGTDEVVEQAALIEDVLRAPFTVGSEEVVVTASIGIAVWSSDHETPIELMRYADTAMYRAKESGRARFEIFDEQMHESVAARLDLESALRFAIDRQELCAYYQPIVALRDGRATHLEALVRWNRPGVRLIAPNEFIQIAEETGLINAIGAWMLCRATEDCARWQDVAPGVGVSVNVSARQFEDGRIVESVESALAESHLPPELLRLEITESVLLEHTDRTIAILRQLKERGVRLALDDFGTGYSSLTYLQRLPLDELKIDRSFVASLEDDDADRTLLRMIVHLGRSLHLMVVAEGIDSVRKLQAVQQLGCHYGQGFLFAQPAPYAQVRARFSGEPVGDGAHVAAVGGQAGAESPETDHSGV
jgi:diguanylate cyclase (GGDEF)-like protein/PAS domain S-box-containing protein